MIAIKYQIKGLEELIRKTDPAILQQPLRDFFKEATWQIQSKVQLETPVNTGQLKDSIHGDVDGASLPLWGTVSTNLMYAPFVEEDTRPHWTSVKNLELWARYHGVNPYALQAAIARRGTRGKHMFQRGLLAWTFSRMEATLARLAAVIETAWETQ